MHDNFGTINPFVSFGYDPGDLCILVLCKRTAAVAYLQFCKRVATAAAAPSISECWRSIPTGAPLHRTKSYIGRHAKAGFGDENDVKETS